jgi:hypothetical protein
MGFETEIKYVSWLFAGKTVKCILKFPLRKHCQQVANLANILGNRLLLCIHIGPIAADHKAKV